MLLPHPNPLKLAGKAAIGLAMLAGTGPFFAGIGVGAGLVGAACLARRTMKRREGWKDEPDSAETEPS